MCIRVALFEKSAYSFLMLRAVITSLFDSSGSRFLGLLSLLFLLR
jgi:hypothetical protein